MDNIDIIMEVQAEDKPVRRQEYLDFKKQENIIINLANSQTKQSRWNDLHKGYIADDSWLNNADVF